MIAVFGASLHDCHAAVQYVRANERNVPVFLFTTSLPFPETEALCERVIVERSSLKLLHRAQTVLWPYKVALAVAVWDTEPGEWLVKLAPFFIPWFRVLVKNENDDFFPARPALLLRHALSRMPALRKKLRYAPRRIALPWLFKRVARWMPALRETVFRSLQGKEVLSLGTVRSSGAGVLRFPNHLKAWDWRRVMAIAESTDCRWLLFAHQNAVTPLDDLLPLFENPRAFVVSRQMDYRSWEPMLAPRAPFRQLQPGEASRLFAPIGRAMLVDREKLLRLGIPKCRNGCAAWLTLFWKAAAAGWPSYAVGGQEALPIVSGWPAEETEFVANLLADPKLAGLAPQSPDLTRGNVAFSCTPTPRAHGSRLKVLLVSPYLPFPLSHGGAVRIYNLCRELSDRLDFLLVCFREQGEYVDYAKLGEVFRQVYVVDRDHKAIPGGSLPHRVSDYDTPTLRALIRDLCEREKPDFLQVEYTHLGGIRDIAPELPAIWVEHDVTFPLYRALGDSIEAAKWERFERSCFGRYDAVWTMCEEDRQAALETGACAERTLVVGNGVDTDRFRPAQELASTPELLFVGAFRHYPNVAAFEALVRQIMPGVWAHCPEARLRVVAGVNPERYWKGALDSRIDLQEFVADLRPLYASAWVVVTPLLVSAGTNIKVLEAMACGKAVVTTPAGCRGLELEDGEECVIREADGSFAAAVAELLQDEPVRAGIGHKARETVARRFSWAAIADQAYPHYQRLKAEVVETEGLIAG